MVMRDSVPCKIPVLGLVAVGVLALGVLPGLTLSQQEQKPAKIVKPSEPTQPAPAAPAQPDINEGNFQLLQPQEFVVAYTQAAPVQGDERERKIKELEDKLQAILKEVKALREGKGTSQATTKPKITEKPATVTRVPVETTYWQAVAVEGQPFTFTNAWITDSGTASKEQTISLSRATYKLPKEKADALAAFLKHVKASVLETKVEDDGITVTTTPDVQHTIAQLVGLLTGQPRAAKGAWKYSVTPTTAAVPANAYKNAVPSTTPVPANATPAPKRP